MGYFDDNGVWFYDENDIISPFHTYSNLAQTNLTDLMESWDLSTPRWRTLIKTTAQSLPNNTWTRLTWTNGLNDPGNTGDNTIPYSLGELTIPIDGIYSIAASVAFQNNPAGAREIALFINGTQYNTEYVVTNQGALPPTFVQIPTAQLRLNAGDVIAIHARQSSGGTLSTYDALGRAANTFSIVKLAAL